jgi:cytochrome c oxidase subunit 1
MGRSGTRATSVEKPWLLPGLWLLAGAVVVGLGLVPYDWWHPTDYSLHDTYYVVAHRHYMLGLAAWFAGFAAAYAVIGRFRLPFRKGLAVGHLGLFVGGVLLLFAPAMLLNWMAPPRRYLDYPDQFEQLNALASVGYVLTLAGVALFVVGSVEALWRRWRGK